MLKDIVLKLRDLATGETLRQQRANARPSSRVSDIATLIESNRDLWQSALKVGKDGPRVLIATNVTGFQHASLLEALLAASLTLRGGQVEFLTCDAALPACLKVEQGTVKSAQHLSNGIADTVCPNCRAVGAAHFGPLGLSQRRFSEYLTPSDAGEVRALCARLGREELSKLRTDSGDEVGMQGLAGALRYYAMGELPSGEDVDQVLRRFVEAALLTTRVFDRLLDEERYDVAVFHHGIYVPQGPAGDVLRRRGVRVVNWNPSYRKSTFIFSHDNSYHYTLMDEPVLAWENLSWSQKEEKEILDYLASRAVGVRDWIWFHEKPEHDAAVLVRERGLDSTRPIIGMLSNVAWDAQLHYPANAFKDMFDWVFRTFEYFEKRPDLQLLLRIHPAEIRGTARSRQPLLDEINRRFPKLPPNIFVIPPESNTSTYAAMALCKAVIIYGTKTGVELSAVGKPVIVAGEAWIRNKGLSSDASSIEEYFAILDRLPNLPPMPSGQIRRAQQYAYHFFFRRMIPIPYVVPSEGKTYGLELDDLSELSEGCSPGLDTICRGILERTPFIYEAEKFGLHA